MAEQAPVIGKCQAEIGDWPGYGFACLRPAKTTREANNWEGREIPVCGIHARTKYRPRRWVWVSR